MLHRCVSLAMVMLIPILVVCSVAFIAISTAVVCFIHRRNLQKPVQGIVLREDGFDVVPGRVVGDGQRVGVEASSSFTGEDSNAAAQQRPDAFADAEGQLPDRRIDTQAVQEEFHLSAEEQRRREQHNQRLNAEDVRMAYPLRANGSSHPLDGTPLAQVVTYFRKLRSSQRSQDDNTDAEMGAAEERTQQEDPTSSVDYGRYLVAVDISLHEPRSGHRRRAQERKVDDASSTTVTDPFGGRTEHDWAALNDVTGVDYMNNEGTAYIPRNAAPDQDAKPAL